MSLSIPKGKQSNTLIRYAYLLLALVMIIALVPANQKFKYEFELGKPWQYDDLLAPFSYPILKPDDKLKEERDAVNGAFEPYYEELADIMDRAITEGEAFIDNNEGQMGATGKTEEYKRALRAILGSIYRTGLLQLEPQHRDLPPKSRIRVIRDKLSKSGPISSFHTQQTVREAIEKKAAEYTSLTQDLLVSAIRMVLQPNLVYAHSLSEQKLQEELQQITTTEGMVEAGELIIQKGITVTELEYKKLSSLKTQFAELIRSEGQGWHVAGYIALIVIIFLIYIGYLQLFQIELARRNRHLLLILINIVFFVVLTRLVVLHSGLSVYVVPYCIVPVVIIAFFEYKLALITHIVVVLIVGSFVPSNAGEFMAIQLIAGFAAIIRMTKVQYLSQFFVSTLFVFLAYLLTATAFQFIKIGTFSEFEYQRLLWLTGNFVLTLLAYPIIYAYERLFGFVSDITLVELSDVNKEVLRKLSVQAPGTFQHSLQVANLSETVIQRIGGNPLLTRVGALYHDLGKMENPEYFIENQKYITNPHDALSDEESARVIIGHVTNGLKLARQYNLPKVVVEFIATHHGTSRVEYFYRNYLKKVPADQVDETKFRYPGPKPTTREMAVVMICDGVEAATRSIQLKTPDSLASIVDQIVDGRVMDGQLIEAPLTLKELQITKEVVKELVNSMYHVRIAYPVEEKA